MKDYICKTCKLHTALTVHHLEHKRYKYICQECMSVSPTFDVNDKEITDKQIAEEKKEWR